MDAEALTPTDDEREALARALWENPINVITLDELNHRADADELDYAETRDYLYTQVDAALPLLRRTEVPEPSTEPGWSHPEAMYSPEVFMEIQGLLNEAQGSPMHALRLAVSRQMSEPQGEPSDAPKVVTLDDVYEVTGLDALVAEARSRGEWCCENGCGSGACETCPCCSAGWCVSGVDGVPEDTEAREFWLEVAAEYNPVAAALRAAGVVGQEGESRG